MAYSSSLAAPLRVLDLGEKLAAIFGEPLQRENELSRTHDNQSLHHRGERRPDHQPHAIRPQIAPFGQTIRGQRLQYFNQGPVAEQPQ